MEKVVTHMFRQLVHSRDSNGKPTCRECIYYSGQIYVTEYRGLRHSTEWEEGRYLSPNVVHNTS